MFYNKTDIQLNTFLLMVPQPDTEEKDENNICRKYKCICIFDLFLAVSHHYICVLFSLENLMFFI